MSYITEDLQRLLEDARDNAPANGHTLRQELRANEVAVGALVSSGAIASVSKNSTSQSYAFGNGTLTTSDMARAWRELINLHDRANGILIASGIAAPTDAQIYTEANARLVTVYATAPDIRLLRQEGA